ncbi:type-F conjugative transfer system pilin assembly protein TrbC [Burkholderia multivorans]|uniref:TrbC family F-type conjugative pilus assembly protein n=1 Tax=Burkholderia multivorans TaxID=87883 RepID=UPI001C24F2DE|nr:TrbC family F-type conjugative pilus assembly protein [Burkholderia multivorans]MBU9371006.1 type VI secretion protein [Burkholderia multivorans]MBU9439457.1 type VI secretion protein [Burkholderia multivorans]MBU9681048.1 type VI secretion protein [Burkholderia multivorans]MCA8318091.1 type-F conjugative transfer system pilin assembly protein TrbC [Burkholderia multivorans]MCA8487795.1 type-F conjugative transfer system pilin assembly protein TrbC [Burkholderia multivorans]
MNRLIVALALFAAAPVHAEPSLSETIAAPWNTYIFVSSRMPLQSIIEVTREASRAHAVIVLTGFAGEESTLTSTQRYAADINRACCTTQPARWIVDPVLTRRYGVTAAPSFVIAHGASENPGEFSKVAGDMSLSQALKFFAQSSRLPSARDYASKLYYATYGTKY